MLFEINDKSEVPIYEQIRDGIVFGIASMTWKPGTELPSARRLSVALGVNVNTANKAYTNLYDEGYIVQDRRRGTIVADKISDDERFYSQLSRRLDLAAAEAICRGMSDMDFVSQCMTAYRKAKGG